MCIGSCIGSMMGSCCCVRTGNICKTDSKNSRLPYIFTFVVFSIVAAIFNLVSDDQIINLPFYSATDCTESCARNEAIYRIGLCLVIFFTTHFLILCIPGTGCFHTFVYLIKFVLLSAMVILSFWLDNSSIDKFADCARWFSLIFLLFQGVMLINWAWDTHDAMMARMMGEDGADAEPDLKYCYILICVALTLASFIMIGFFFLEYTEPNSECAVPKTFLSLTLIFSVFEIVASYFIGYGNGFVASILMVYLTYLNFQALATYSDTECENPSWSNDAPMYTGFFLLIATLSYVGYETRLLNQEEQRVLAGEDIDIKSGNKTAGEAHNNPIMRKMNGFFHLTMTMGSFYVTMVMTNWGDDGTSDTRWYGEPANAWLNILAEWFMMLIYVWVLFAPKILPDRQFAYAQY